MVLGDAYSSNSDETIFSIEKSVNYCTCVSFFKSVSREQVGIGH